jgi:hypothetical protein
LIDLGVGRTAGSGQGGAHETKGIQEFRHPPTSRSEQLAGTPAHEAARRFEAELTETIVACA